MHKERGAYVCLEEAWSGIDERLELSLLLLVAHVAFLLTLTA